MMDAQLKARLASKRFSEEPGPDLPRHYAEQGSFEDDESTLDGSSWKMDEVVVQEEEEEEEEEEAPKQDEDDDEEERASTSRRSSLWLQEASRESMVGLGHYAVDSVANPMVRLAEAKEAIELEGKTKLRLGVHWQFFPGMPKVDLDLTAVCFDGFGTTLDAAHCNHRSAYGGALKHSGDEGILTNKHSGDASLELIEFIDFDMPSIPEHVQAVALVVNARSGGTFKDVESAYANLRCLDEKVPEALAEFEVSGFGGAKDTGLLIGVMYMTPDTDLAPSEWVMLAKNATVEGETFVASLPQVQAIVDEVLDIDGALREERILKANETFDMEKYDTFVLPSDLFQGRGKRDLKIGLNWEGSVDLDASIVAVYKPSTNSIDGLVDGEVIFSGRLEGCEGSIRHLGDETGIGQAALLEFKHEGATYWRNVKYNELYDPETKDLVGIWDPDLQIINLAPIPKHLGEGEFVGGTDREVLLVDLDAIPTYVKTLNVVITRAVSLMSGEGIAKSTQGSCYVRLVTCNNNHELARYDLSDPPETEQEMKGTGAILLELSKSVDDTWRVLPKGQYVPTAGGAGRVNSGISVGITSRCGITGNPRAAAKMKFGMEKQYMDRRIDEFPVRVKDRCFTGCFGWFGAFSPLLIPILWGHDKGCGTPGWKEKGRYQPLNRTCCIPFSGGVWEEDACYETLFLTLPVVFCVPIPRVICALDFIVGPVIINLIDYCSIKGMCATVKPNLWRRFDRLHWSTWCLPCVQPLSDAEWEETLPYAEKLESQINGERIPGDHTCRPTLIGLGPSLFDDITFRGPVKKMAPDEHGEIDLRGSVAVVAFQNEPQDDQFKNTLEKARRAEEGGAVGIVFTGVKHLDQTIMRLHNQNAEYAYVSIPVTLVPKENHVEFEDKDEMALELAGFQQPDCCCYDCRTMCAYSQANEAGAVMLAPYMLGTTDTLLSQH